MKNTNWCEGFCTQCGTGCSQYCETIKELKDKLRAERDRFLKLEKDWEELRFLDWHAVIESMKDKINSLEAENDWNIATRKALEDQCYGTGDNQGEHLKALKERDQLQEQVKELTGALEFYADKNNWKGSYIVGGSKELGDFKPLEEIIYIQGDRGERARKALAKLKGASK